MMGGEPNVFTFKLMSFVNDPLAERNFEQFHFTLLFWNVFQLILFYVTSQEEDDSKKDV